MNRWMWWVTLVTSAVSVVIADVFMKKAAISWSLRSYVGGWLFYILSIPGWYIYLKGTRFATCGVLFSIVTDSLILVLGIAYFKETVSLRQWVGFALGIGAVLLLSSES